MELRHRFSVPAPIEQTWAIFDDIGAVAGCFPGAAIESATDDRCEGSVKIKLGPISMQYGGTATRVECSEADRRIRIHAAGRDKRGQGTADAKMTAVLVAEGEATQVEVTTDLAITGKPARFGRGMIQDVSDRYLARFVDALSQRVSAESRPPADPGGSGDVDVLASAFPGLLRRNRAAIAATGVAVAALVLLRLTIGRGAD